LAEAGNLHQDHYTFLGQSASGDWSVKCCKPLVSLPQFGTTLEDHQSPPHLHEVT
jgi:hypothetical protein